MLANPFASNWLLDPEITFLNHGSFGACPATILEKQQEYRNRMEREPVSFMIRELDGLMDQSLKAIAAFVKSDPANLVFVPNVTHGVNSVLRSLTFKTGDELIITNHIYHACRVVVNFLAQQAGIKIREVEIEFPVSSPEEVKNKILEAVNKNTRLVFIDHITSPTGLIFPVEEIVRELNLRDVDCFVDGAHAPGAISLELESLGAAYYTGNCHKWMCAPKGIGFLYVRPDKQKKIYPLALSHFSEEHRSLTDRFFWPGTTDPTAALCLPDVINWIKSLLPGGWEELMDKNHLKIVEARMLVCDGLGIPVPCPDDMISTMAAIPFGQSKGSVSLGYNEIDELQERLFHEYRIEVPVFCWPEFPNRIIRFSAQIYNTRDQYEELLKALLAILKGA